MTWATRPLRETPSSEFLLGVFIFCPTPIVTGAKKAPRCYRLRPSSIGAFRNIRAKARKVVALASVNVPQPGVAPKGA
jgi:hypothetical protein